MPNAFSPNGDGENEYLRVRGEKISHLELSLYNRWGELVFESTDVNMIKNEYLGWDGKYGGTMQDPGVFVYSLKVICNDGYEFTKKGNVTLIR
jgi:gliding motility-associated-like protein